MDLCKNLNYVRSLSPGKAVFYTLDENAKPRALEIETTTLSSNKSSYSEIYSGENFKITNITQQKLSYSNIQRIEECYVPFGVNEVYCHFCLRLNANSFSPQICGEEKTRKTLEKFSKSYFEADGYKELSKRIAKNILMGTWLWRNRSKPNLSIEVILSNGEVIAVSNAYSLSWHGTWDDKAEASLNNLTGFIQEGLTDKSNAYFLEIKATLDVKTGDEIYPSQEFLEKDNNAPKGSIIKELAKASLPDGTQTAAFHSQKIGAALLKIDDWYAENEEPLRVNEYGVDREHITARRYPTKNRDKNKDFYSLITKTEIWTKQIEENQRIPDEAHFIMSVLLKGGLFSLSKEEK